MTDSAKTPRPPADGTFLGHPIPDLDRAGLRQFALIFAAIIAVLFGLLLPFLFDFSYRAWPWIVGGAVALTGLAHAPAINPLYQVWMRFGVIMNIIMSRVILGTVFVLTVIPAGLIFRLRGKDILDVRLDREATSYRQENRTEHANDLNKPY